MPFAKRSKYSPKKKSRKLSVPRAYALNSALVHKHVVTCSTSDFTPLYITLPSSGVAMFNFSGVTSANMALSFTLAGMVVSIGGLAVSTIPLPNVSELKALYDSYVIEKVDVNIWSGATQAQIGQIGTPDVGPVPMTGFINYHLHPLPLIGYVVDMDDATNTSISALQQYSQYKCQQLGQGKPISCSFTPCCNDTLSNSTGYGRSSRQIINSANDTVQHFGLKLAVDGFKAGNDVAHTVNTFLSCQARYHLRMIATR